MDFAPVETPPLSPQVDDTFAEPSPLKEPFEQICLKKHRKPRQSFKWTAQKHIKKYHPKKIPCEVLAAGLASLSRWGTVTFYNKKARKNPAEPAGKTFVQLHPGIWEECPKVELEPFWIPPLSTTCLLHAISCQHFHPCEPTGCRKTPP